MSFFDAPWHIVLLLFAALILFGSSRLPGAAKALGSSMNIFKKSFKGGDEEQEATPGLQPTNQAGYQPPTPQITSGPAVPSQQAQIDALQHQLSELQRQQPTPAETPSQTRPS
ncbi:MAG: twin-arginine translocase TatA/TatE family subunit [Streptosporangiaceae bacterium]